MKTKPALLILIAIFALQICSCDSDKSALDQRSQQIPKVLQQKKQYAPDLLGSSRRKSKPDLVNELYLEALSKDPELQRLNQEIINISRNGIDSLEAYYNYSAVMQDYWSSSSRVLSNINDSILSQKVGIVFEGVKKEYEGDMSEFKNDLKAITGKSISLDDQLKTLKLLTSLQLIKEYQTTQRPDVEQLRNLIRDYEILIEDSKKHYNLNK